MGKLILERLGGLAGFGAPNAKVRGIGRLAMADLSDQDRTAIEALFEAAAPPPKAQTDAIRYRVTLEQGGETRTLEVAHEALPRAVTAAVRDQLI